MIPYIDGEDPRHYFRPGFDFHKQWQEFRPPKEKPSFVFLCADCGAPKEWMRLIYIASGPEDLRWFDFCNNLGCNSGPTLISDLGDLP